MTTDDRRPGGVGLPRLGRDTRLPADVPGPRVVPSRIGIVHLGIGAFHRAHQAVVTEDAAACTDDTRWGILGVTQRSGAVRDQLRPQGGRYAVLTAGRTSTSLRVVGSVVDVAYPAEETARILATIAATDTHLVTLTVTEKGYGRADDGRLDLAGVRADLDALESEHVGGAGGPDRPADSTIGLLVRGLAARHRAGATPLTVLSCDNMVGNGRVLEGLVHQALDATPAGRPGTPLRDWVTASVTFPCSMVDRIVPATSPEQREAAVQRLGARDEGLVVAEPYLQWIIEDRFAGPRPAWERGGAVFTEDVGPYELAKLRLLNGTHSLLAYAGALAGHATIAEAVADPEILTRARSFLFDDALPTLTPPGGLDLHGYGEQILDRFANPATGHTTVQVAMDGSQKIPYRWGETIVQRLDAGELPLGAAFAVAAWVVFVSSGRDVHGRDLPLVDPRAGDLRAALVGIDPSHDDAARATVEALLAVDGIFPESVRMHEEFVQRVTVEVGKLTSVLVGRVAGPT